MKEAYNYLLNEIGLKYGDNVVVGVSGGPDSMALLHLACRLKKAMDINVICAHVNHNVRKESDSEKEFVEKFCANNNVIFEYIKIDNWGDDNFHNEARSKRYNYFNKIIKKYNAKFLFTAHHGDDLVETILMRIVRGSTLRGYSGFSRTIDMGDYFIIRPLINVTKGDIVAYDKKHKISYVLDKSNEKDVYTRNRFRKYILPALKNEDKNVHQKFYKFSKTLLMYNDYIDRQVEKVINYICPQNIINIEKFKEQEYVIGMKIIYYILEQIYQDDLMLITDHHAELIYNLLTSKKANLRIHLPNNIQAVKAYNTLTFVREKTSINDYEIELINYANLPNGKNIEVIEKTTSDSNNICRLSKKDVAFPLHIRTRHDGDKMSVKGMLGRKKINDIFIDDKIPMAERDLWPIVVDSNENIVWLPGLKKSKLCKTKDEKYDIILKYY